MLDTSYQCCKEMYIHKGNDWFKHKIPAQTMDGHFTKTKTDTSNTNHTKTVWSLKFQHWTGKHKTQASGKRQQTQVDVSRSNTSHLKPGIHLQARTDCFKLQGTYKQFNGWRIRLWSKQQHHNACMRLNKPLIGSDSQRNIDLLGPPRGRILSQDYRNLGLWGGYFSHPHPGSLWFGRCHGGRLGGWRGRGPWYHAEIKHGWGWSVCAYLLCWVNCCCIVWCYVLHCSIYIHSPKAKAESCCVATSGRITPGLYDTHSENQKVSCSIQIQCKLVQTRTSIKYCETNTNFTSAEYQTEHISDYSATCNQ